MLGYVRLYSAQFGTADSLIMPQSLTQTITDRAKATDVRL